MDREKIRRAKKFDANSRSAFEEISINIRDYGHTIQKSEIDECGHSNGNGHLHKKPDLAAVGQFVRDSWFALNFVHLP